jgi:ADP-ribose pyrophosphatase YjhB (NUDIX family)
MGAFRQSTRALILDPSGDVLLVRFDFPPFPWATPGGGIEAGEPDEQALRRELPEELGLDEFNLGPCIWRREHKFPMEDPRYSGQQERIYLVRIDRFDPKPRIDLSAEHVRDVRWWTLAEIEASGDVFAPRKLSRYLRELLERGPPADPINVGI